MNSSSRTDQPENTRRWGVVRALMVATATVAVVAPLTTTKVETAAVTCSFGSGGSSNSSESCNTLAPNKAVFDFDNYVFELEFKDLNGDFQVTVTNVPMSQNEFESRIDGPPESDGDFFLLSHNEHPTFLGYVCIPLVNPSGVAQPCVDFQVDAPDGAGVLWSQYLIKIDWEWDSHNNGFDGSNGRARILHDIGNTISNDYDEDMCTQAENDVPNYVPCEYSPFPFISSGNTDFSSFTAALRPAVPEPALLALFGAGAAAALYRRRQRRQ